MRSVSDSNFRYFEHRPETDIMQASLPRLNDAPSVSLWPTSGLEPAAGHRSLLTGSLSRFRQRRCHSPLSRRMATSVLALRARTVQYIRKDNTLHRACCCTGCQRPKCQQRTDWQRASRLRAVAAGTPLRSTVYARVSTNPPTQSIIPPMLPFRYRGPATRCPGEAFR